MPEDGIKLRTVIPSLPKLKNLPCLKISERLYDIQCCWHCDTSDTLRLALEPTTYWNSIYGNMHAKSKQLHPTQETQPFDKDAVQGSDKA